MKKFFNSKLGLIALLALSFASVYFSFSFLVVKDLSGSLFGSGDVNIWEYTGFYFSKNLSFVPIPKLDLVNNQVFYPYGVNSVFQGWGAERDLFYALMQSFYGMGPWLQIYYMFTVLVTSIGTFILLVRDYGLLRAGGAGFIVYFFNFYAICKYPHHLNISVIHWTILSFIADFIIVKRVVGKQRVSLRLILVRACLLILSMSQDLGYIAGYALMSFTVSALFMAFLLTYRYFKREFQLTESVFNLLESYKYDFFTSPRQSVALLGLGVVAAYLYLPLAFQIAREAKSFNMSDIPASDVWSHTAGWANPFRLLIPFFPVLNPGIQVLNKVFLDKPESLGSGSVGWFLLIIGSLGLCQSRKRILIYIPLIIILIFCLFYHPDYFPTLKVFPWFAFNRVADRSTVIYPCIFCIFALEINLDVLKKRSKQWILGLLICLTCTEIYMGYSLKLGYLYKYRAYPQTQNLLSYMNYVKSQPGEAVLDWPFCIEGANYWEGTKKLCPYFKLNNDIYALRRFHEKKVMGHNFARLHPSQIQQYLQAGWDKLFFPNEQRTGQKRCFRPDEWSFFTEFYKFNDFAGINLYVDLLPKECVAEFYTRFGNPTIETEIPRSGRLKFIPKSPELRSQVNLAIGASLKFKP